MTIENNFRNALPMSALDIIPEPKPSAKSITGLIKEGGTITGYQLSDGQVISKENGVSMAKCGEIQGVGIAHNKGTEYLKSLPDSKESNNLGSLPTIDASI